MILSLRGGGSVSDTGLNNDRNPNEKGAESDLQAKENDSVTQELRRIKSILSQAQRAPSESRFQTPENRALEDSVHAKQSSRRNPKPNDSVLAPISTNTPLSPNRAERLDSKSVPAEKYLSLVEKYNLVFRNWMDIKETRTRLEVSLRSEKDKLRKYNQFCNELEKKLAKKQDQIRLLEVKVQFLEGKLPAHSLLDATDETRGNQENIGHIITTDDPDAVEAALFQAAQHHSIIDNPGSAEPALRDTHEQDVGLRAELSPAIPTDAKRRSPQIEQHNTPQSNELPMLLNSGGAVDHQSKDYLPEIIEPHHSSSTGGPDFDPANELGDQGISIKTESVEDEQSSGDIPVVVQERLIRKRNTRSDAKGTPKVKVETLSSSPIGLAGFAGLDSHESLDLDDIGSKQMTPRKQRSLRQKLARPVLYETRSRRRLSDPENNHPVDTIEEEDYDSPDMPMNEEKSRADSAPVSLEFPKPVLPRTSSYRATKRRRLTPGIAIEQLAEDGENMANMDGLFAQRESPRLSGGRLMRLLENPTPTNRATLNASLAAQSSTGNKSKSVTTPNIHTPTREGKPCTPRTTLLKNSARTPDTTPRQPSTSKARNSHLRDLTKSTPKSIQNQPLRSKPLEELTLLDFKVNPKYNNGYDYAFTDVVRNQDARRCLAGCTKPECCGTVFRALAEATYDANRLPTASQEDSEMRLLREFLGDNAHKIRNMTKAERDETLVQAKTRDLANKHGRHRHAYERRRSPPGFWRADFPSTQEEREDRRKIEQQERDLVAQRYREAMRAGGAYMFRDE